MTDLEGALRYYADANGRSVAQSLTKLLNRCIDLGIAINPESDDDGNSYDIGWYVANKWYQLSVEYDSTGKQWVIVESKMEAPRYLKPNEGNK